MVDIPPPPLGFTVDTNVPLPPAGFKLDSQSSDKNYVTDPVRKGYQSVAENVAKPINKTVNNVISSMIPQGVKDASSWLIDKEFPVASKLVPLAFQAGNEEIEDLSSYDQGGKGNLAHDLSAFRENANLAGNMALGKSVAGSLKGTVVGDVTSSLAKEATDKITNKIPNLSDVRNFVNAKSDAAATKVPVTQPNSYILKTLTKAGHSPEEIVDGFKRAKEHGLTIGEAFNNPDILGEERKISGMNNTGGRMLRDHVKARVDPNNNVSMPFRLKNISDPLVKKVDEASKAIGKLVSAAPKTPLNMNKVISSLVSEKRPIGSAVTNTLDRIDGLVEWAKTEGNTFETWHRVKQEIYALGKEATDPSAVAKLDKKTVTDYYNKINDVLSGRSGDLPKDLAETGARYARENANFHQNLAGRTISDVLKTMPEGGTPASSLKYLYNKLAGNKELRDELFEGIPESQRDGMIKLLEAIKDAGRAGTNDIVKSMQQGSPSFPLTTSQVVHRAYDKIIDFIFRKDYDGLAKALTSPEVEQIAKKLGYVKPLPPQKPILRLTYQPKNDIFVGRDTEAIIGNEKIMDAAKNVRDRMEKLGYGPGVLRAQDLNVIREMEKKYGASELGKFMIEHRNEPIMGRAWEVPQTEYNQATVDKMLGKDAMSRLEKLDKETRDSLHSELRTIWDQHKTTLGEMALDARRSIENLAAAKNETSPSAKFGHNNLGDKLLESINTGTPIESVITQIKP